MVVRLLEEALVRVRLNFGLILLLVPAPGARVKVARVCFGAHATHEKKLQPSSATQRAWQSSADVMVLETVVVPLNQPGNVTESEEMISSMGA